MAGGFFESLLSGILGDAKRPDAERPELGVPMLAHWLPYRSYDPKTGIFYNSASRGFVIEAAPLVGAEPSSKGAPTASVLPSALSETDQPNQSREPVSLALMNASKTHDVPARL